MTALHPGPAVWTGFEASYWAELLEKEAREAHDEAAATLSGRAGSARVVEGQPVSVLREARDHVNATLLALGGRHSSRLLGIVLGSTVTELLHDGVCSVFVVRPPEQGTWQPRTIVAGVDGSASSLAGLACADDIATRLGGRVEAVAAGEAATIQGDGDWPERLERRADAEPVATLLERSREVDLVVVGSRSAAWPAGTRKRQRAGRTRLALLRARGSRAGHSVAHDSRPAAARGQSRTTGAPAAVSWRSIYWSEIRAPTRPSLRGSFLADNLFR